MIPSPRSRRRARGVGLLMGLLSGVRAARRAAHQMGGGSPVDDEVDLSDDPEAAELDRQAYRLARRRPAQGPRAGRCHAAPDAGAGRELERISRRFGRRFLPREQLGPLRPAVEWGEADGAASNEPRL
jgi:hypothetical protein